MKTLDTNQSPKIERPYLQPFYFCHIYFPFQDQCVNGTATADAATTGFEASKAFDNSVCIGNYWEATPALPHWIKYKVQGNGKRYVDQYTILCPSLAATTGPKDFKLQGCDDDATWVDLDTQAGITWEAYQKRSFTLAAGAAYKYFRLYVTAVGAGTTVQIDDIELGMADWTMYLSDKNFQYNGHTYEAYLKDIPQTVQSIEKIGGYSNLSATIGFWNRPYRNYTYLIEWFDVCPIVQREMDLYVLYKDTGETFVSDVSTKLYRLSIGEFSNIKLLSFQCDLSSIAYGLKNKQMFNRINTTNWPSAAPNDIGKYENHVYGAVKDLPCHCVYTGAVNTLFMNCSPSDTTLYISDVDFPMAFPSSGTIMIEDEQIAYTTKSSANKTLSGCTRGYNGTTAATHNRGEVVWENKATYVYLANAGISQSIDAVYGGSDKVRIPSAQYTVNKTDGMYGNQTTITFIVRPYQILKKLAAATVVDTGSHDHGYSNQTSQSVWGTSGSFYPFGSGWSQGGSEVNFRDNNPATNAWCSNNGSQGAYYICQTNFPAWGGGTIAEVIVHVTHATTLNSGSDCELYGGTVGHIDWLQTQGAGTYSRSLGTTYPSYIATRPRVNVGGN